MHKDKKKSMIKPLYVGRIQALPLKWTSTRSLILILDDLLNPKTMHGKTSLNRKTACLTLIYKLEPYVTT